MTKAAAFRQADLTRAVKAVQAAGTRVAKVVLDPSGSIVLFMGTESTPDSNEPNEWDEVFRQ